MRFVDMQGFCIRLDKQIEFQRWLVENEERIRKSYPAGMEYGGCYLAVFSSEKNAGEYYWLDLLDSYGAMDRSAALNKDTTSDFVRATATLGAFGGPDGVTSSGAEPGWISSERPPIGPARSTAK